MAGLVVLTATSRGSGMVDLQEGDDVRPGQTIMTVVNPSQMQVSTRVNQVDISRVYVGQPADIGLDAYPDYVFPGMVESIGAIGTSSSYVKKIRYFSVVASIQGSNPILLPDLTASVDLQLESAQDVLILPREAVFIRNGETMVEILETGKPKLQRIKLGLINDCEVVIESGLEEGAIVSLNPQIPAGEAEPLPDQI